MGIHINKPPNMWVYYCFIFFYPFWIADLSIIYLLIY